MKLFKELSGLNFSKQLVLQALAIIGFSTIALAQCDGSLNVTIQTTPSTCGLNNASLNSTVNGGTTPYSYAWSNSSTDSNISGVAAGGYSLTVTDNNGCTASASTTVLSISCPVVATQSVTNVIQNAATVNWSAVDCAVKYRIFVRNLNTSVQQLFFVPAPATSFTIPDLDPNTPYTVRIRTQCSDNGNTVSKLSAIMSFSTPPCDGLLSLSSIVSDATCGLQNGGIDLTVNNGASPYDFSWSNTQTTEDLNNIGEGSYTVNVTDALSCTVSGNYTVINTGAASSFTLNASVCDNELPFVVGSQEFNSSGTYEVILNNSQGCDSVVTLNLSVTASPLLSDISGLTTLCPGTTTTYSTDDIPGVTYNWSYSSNWITNSGASTNSVNVTAVDTSFVTVIATNSCAADTLSIYVNSTCPKPTGIEVTSVDATSATIVWDNADCNQEYQVRIKQVGTGIWTEINVGTATTYTFTGLTALKNYQYKVINICSNLPGSPILYGPVYPFTTPDANGCSTPQNITVNNISATSVNVSWDAQVSESFRLRLREVGTSAWTNYDISGALDNFTITDLNPATSYEFQLRAECSTDIFTPYSSFQNFTTGTLRLDEANARSFNAGIYPNPTANNFTLNINADKESTYTISITDIFGRTISVQTEKIFEGTNTIPFNIEELPSGIYVVQINDTYHQQNLRLIKK